MEHTALRWEYSVLKFQATGFWTGGNISEEEIEDACNAKGSEGWELVNIFDTSETHGKSKFILATFKRPVVTE